MTQKFKLKVSLGLLVLGAVIAGFTGCHQPSAPNTPEQVVPAGSQNQSLTGNSTNQTTVPLTKEATDLKK